MASFSMDNPQTLQLSKASHYLTLNFNISDIANITSSDFESYCFTSAASTIWNSLSVTTRTANSIGTFRSRLKSDLFAKAYAA